MTIPHSNHKLWILGLTVLAGLGLALALPALARAGQSSKDNPAASANAIIYVAKTGDGSDGSSWAQAYTDLQDALAAAESSDQIWVATGVYYPDQGSGQSNDDRNSTFMLASGVEIYGGFDPDSGADLFEERDWQAFPTVLSGDIDHESNPDTTDANGVLTDTTNIAGSNAYHVVTAFGGDSSIVLDGFIITGGQANGSFFGICGDQCGGGMYNFENSPTLNDVTFSGNSAGGGGGMFNWPKNPVLTNVTFSGNSADYGGGMYNWSGSPTLADVTFTGNSSTNYGGGMYNTSSSPVLTNVTFSGNSADSGGGMYNNDSSSPNVRNSILWNNQDSSGTGTISATITNDSNSAISLTHSLIQGSASWTGDVSFIDLGGNLDTDPLFLQAVDPASAPSSSGNLRLAAGSPAIDAGDDQYVSVSSDLDGQPRIIDGDFSGTATVDMGTYEYQGDCPSGSVLHVDRSVPSAGNGAEWATALTSLQGALNAVQICNGITEIYVATGIYTPGTTVTDTFQLLDGVASYGGFDPASGADQFAERDWQAFPTVLSGDIDGDDTTDPNGVVTDPANITGSNAYHVVTGSGVDSRSVLDGFTITAGQANGGAPHDAGGGIYTDSGSPTLAQLTFSGNAANNGGGMFNDSSSPALTGVTFSGNSASFGGGGMYNISSSNPTLTDVAFSGNSANSNGGGMFNFLNSHPTLINVVLSGNSANSNGGGMYNDFSNVTLTNVTISGNSANSNGGGIYNNFASPVVRNSILWNNQDSSGTGTISATVFNSSSAISLTHSLIQGSGGSSWTADPNFMDGGGNLDSDPLLIQEVDPASAPTSSGDLRLAADSRAINAGDNQYVSGVATDLDGQPRISDGTVDMGAYEFQFYPLMVSLAGPGAGSVSSTPAGIDCGTDCSASYADGSVVTLTASADIGSIFAGWSGACTNSSGDCVVTMDAAREVTASFALEQHSLAVSLAGDGGGSVSSDLAGISCSPAAGADCSSSFNYGSVVTLTASADSGSIFAGWSGDCTNSSGDCVVTMTEAKAVTATFHQRAIYLPLVSR